MAGKIAIDTEQCKGCGLCVAVCPKGSIVICEKSNKNGYFPARQAKDECTGCAMCALVCPDVAIEVYRDNTGRTKDAAEPGAKGSLGGQAGLDRGTSVNVAGLEWDIIQYG